MEHIIWNDSFSVGVTEIDNQHARLVKMINRLIDEQKQLTDQTTIAELLTQMTDYAGEHFRSEEFLMAEYGYENLTAHVRIHGEFLARTMEFMSASSNVGPNLLSKALLEYLKSWLVNHILEEDMKYKTFFQAKGVS